MRRAWILALMSVGGCAYGGGGGDGTDSGPAPRTDSGPGIDSGPRPDGGLPGTDSGAAIDSGGGSCSETPCRLVSPQCGCTPGQGCYLSGAGRVCGTPGPEREGQSCSGPTACVQGYLCIGAASGSFCARFCDTDADCPGGTGSLCLTQIDDGSGGAVPGVTLCTIHCTPTTGSGCPTDMGCTIFQESAGAMRTFSSCRAAGSGVAGSVCTDEEDCTAGHLCAEVSAGRRECIRICTVPGGFECSGLETCNAFTDRLLLGGTEYGYCF